jgi:hypothetical protein
MKNILLILLVSCVGVVAQTNVITPIGQLPNVGTNVTTNMETVLANPNVGNYNWTIAQMVAYLNNTLSFATTNYVTNFVYITNNFTNNYTNIVITNINIIGAIETGYTNPPASTTSATNFYWFDFGISNSFGQNCIYATLLATNNVDFLGVTNLNIWKLLSVNVVASGGNRVIALPNTWPHFNTNGWTSNGNIFYLTLTNGNEFRITIQSNITQSVIWTTVGQ